MKLTKIAITPAWELCVLCVRMLHKRSSRHGRFRPSNSRQEGTKIAKGVSCTSKAS